MENLIFGIIAVLLAGVGYFISWKYYKKNKFIPAVLMLMASGFILRVYTATDHGLHTWDERYHALVAKNLMDHPLLPTLYDEPVLEYDYRSWTSNHVWLHKQPMALWGMSASMSLFGVNVYALRLPSVLLSTLAIGLIFSLGRILFDQKVGYLAAFFLSLNGLILELTGGRVTTDHVDIFFMFFILLAILFGFKFARTGRAGYNVLAGLALGAAILSKWLPALIVLPVWLFGVYHSGRFSKAGMAKQFFVVLGVGLAVCVPWQAYTFFMFPEEAAWESYYNLIHLTEGLEGHAKPWHYFLGKIRINYGELVYLPIAWFVWKSFTPRLNFNMLAVSLWFLVPLLVFSIARTKMQGYMLISAPALFLMTSAFYFELRKHRERHRANRPLKWLITLVLFLLIALPVRYALERMKPFQLRDRNPAWVSDLKALNREEIPRGVLFNYQRPIEAMFYTDLTAYPNIPDTAKLGELMQSGYAILIAEGDDIPDAVRNMEGVRIWENSGVE